MLEIRNKKRVKNILYSPIILLIMAIIFVILFRGVLNVYKKERLSYQYLKQDKIELQKILLRQQNLVSSLNYLKTDQGVESEIRSKFRLVKEGEKISVIIDDQNTEITTVSTTTENSFWYKILNWLN